MASASKLIFVKSTVCQLFRVVVKATEKINKASFTHDQNKCSYKVDIMAQGSEFYVPNIFRDCIVVTAKGISRHQHVVSPWNMSTPNLAGNPSVL